MFQCANCGGNLRFDIPTQKLLCDYCQSEYDCYDVSEHDNAGTSESYQVNVFTCPQCGGEIIGTDQSAAEFCSYCGSSVVLEKKLRDEKRPSKIIPFQITKEDCKKAYTHELRRALFAPKELKNPEYLERFRGIYMPYWSYSFHHDGPVELSGTQSYSKGDYDITDYYTVTGELHGDYEGIMFDASSSFDDEISQSIAPYDPSQMKEFTPSYLSGFYADTADVASKLYQDDANTIANEESLRVIQNDSNLRSYDIEDDTTLKKLNEKMMTQIEEPVAAMIPVWFLTWRDRDRVAYTTINGQTGKVCADIPVDIRKFIAFSVLLALPIFLLLEAIISLAAPLSLSLTAVLCVIAGVVYFYEMTEIEDRDKRKEDKGFQAKIRKKKADKTDSSDERWTIGDYLVAGGWIGLIIVFVIAFFLLDSTISAIFNRFTIHFFLISIVITVWVYAHRYQREHKLSYPMAREIAVSQIAAIAACVISMIHPVSDLFYYGGMMLCYLGVFITMIMIIRRYNLLITRPIPNLHKRGGNQA